MKNILSPSILSADFAKLGEQLALADKAGAQYIHIDVMDGLFVPSISYGMPVIKSIRKTTDKVFDVHLMIVEPERYIQEFIDCGADLITFHLEATEKAAEIIDEIHRQGKKAGISIKPGTDVEAVRPYLGTVDMILVMTVGFPELFDAKFEKGPRKAPCYKALRRRCGVFGFQFSQPKNCHAISKE